MAQNQANFGLNFRVDKSGLNDLKKSLQDIMNLGRQRSATGNLEGDLKEACQAAQKLETILNGAWNSKLGQLNLDKVNQGIKQTYHSVEDLQKALGKTPQGQAAFNKMASQVLNTNLQLRQTNKLLDDMATSMANTVKWGITSSIFNNMTRSVQDAFYYVKGLNSSLTDIRIVTGASTDQMAAFAEKANAAAKALGQTTRNYTDASLIYYQQGLSEADVEARTQTTLKAANVTGQSTEEVSELLTSVWNGYKVSAAEAELYIDKIAAVATTTASDLEELSVGMSKVASAASLMGVDIDQLNAQLATIVSVTRQAPESVGTALKTIYARMGDIEAGLDGETTLGTYTEKMKEMGFNVLDAQGKLRDMGGVIEEIGGKWSSMTREQQLSLAQTVAGTRQYNNLLALFDNWDMYTNALHTSSEAMGTLQEQNDMYLESTEAKLKQLKAELESTYSSMLNTDTLNTAIDGVTQLVEAFNGFIDGLGGGGQALAYFGSMAVNVFSKQIGTSLFQTIQNIKSVKTNLEAFKAKEKWANAVLNDVKEQHLAKGEGELDDSALAKEAQYAKKTLQVRKALTDEQYKQFTAMQAEIGVRERELNYLREYKNLSNTIMDYDDASVQALEERLALEEKLLSSRKARKDQTSRELRNYERVQPESEEDTAYLQERLGTLGNIVATEEEYVQLETILDKLATGKNLKEEENAFILELEARVVQEQTKLVQQLKQAIKGKKAAEDGTLEALEKQQRAQEELLRQQQEQAAKQAKLQTIVKAMGAALEIGIPLVEGLSQGLDESASGAERLNGFFAAGTGALAGILDCFLPGSGIIVQGISSVVQMGLEALGVWDKWEDSFSSSAEKIEKLNTSLDQVSATEQQSSSQIAYLKSVEDEFEDLSEKAGRYGEYLDQLSEEEQNRYLELTGAFTEYNDALILGYDDQGRAIIDNQNAIKDTIALLEKQAELEYRDNVDASKSLKDKDKEIADKEKEIADIGSSQEFEQNASEFYLNSIYLTKILEEYGKYKELLTDEAKNIQTAIQDENQQYMTIAELIDSINQRADSFFNEGLTYDNLTEYQKIVNTLNEVLSNSENYNYVPTLGEEMGPIIPPNFTFEDEEFLYAEENLQKFFDKYKGVYDGLLATANEELAQLQILDPSIIFPAIKYGEGYDQQWDSLSAEAQDIGTYLVLDYIKNLEFGMVKAKADADKTGVYETAVSLTQEFIESFGKVFELANNSLQKNIEDADLSNFEGTASERKEKILEIIQSTLGSLDLSEFQQDEQMADALEAYFKQIFNLSTLDIDFDSGEVSQFATSIGAKYSKARKQIADYLSKYNLHPDSGLTQNWLEGVIDEDQIDNIEAILANLDLGAYSLDSENNSDILMLEKYLLAAVEATKNAQSVMAQYNSELQTHNDIIEKFNNKEQLNASELEYLKILESEYPILRNLQRGTEAYTMAMKKAQKQKTEDYKRSLKQQRAANEENIKLQSAQLGNIDRSTKEGRQEYDDTQAEIDRLKGENQSIDYELNVVLVANPSIKEQIDALYDEADTLLSLRATVENDQALSEDQTQGLTDFFADTQGQPWLGEYLETGTITDEILDAAEAFAASKIALAQQSKEDLITQAQELTSAASVLRAEAEAAFNEGRVNEAMQKLDSANAKYSEASSLATQAAAIDSAEIQTITDSIATMEDLNEVMAKDTYTAENLSQAMDTVAENILKAENIDTDGFEEYVEVLEDMYKETGLTTAQIKKLALQDKILVKGLESVNKNFKTWSSNLNKTEKGNEDWNNTIAEMTECVEDLVGVQPSKDFFDISTEQGRANLELLRKAMSGTQKDLLNLQHAAAKDLVISGDIKIAEGQQDAVLAEIDNLTALMQARLDAGELVPGQNINDGPMLQALSNIVAACAGTAADAEALLANLGFDAEVVEAPAEPETHTSSYPIMEYRPGPDVPVGDSKDEPGRVMRSALGQATSTEVTTIQGGVKATALKIKSANYVGGGNISRATGGGRSSGGGGGGRGGGGGGGGGGKSATKVKTRKKDYYHDVNNNLKKLTSAYDKLAEVQEKTFGKKHIDNLTKINKNLDNQINKMRERIKIANEQEKVDLKKDITSQYSEVKFNKDGTIANYEEVLAKYYAAYSNTGQSKEAQDEAKEKYDKLKELLDEYETLILETIPEWEAEIREKINEKYENMTAQFEYEITMRTDWGESIREYKEFKHEFGDFTEDLIAQSTLAYNTSKSFFDSKELTSKTRQLNDALGELEKINSALKKGKDISKKGDEEFFSDIWGDNKQGLMDYIATLQTDLMDNLLAISDARNEAYDNYLEAIDEGISKMNEHLDQYNQLTEELDHNRNLIELIYGEESDKIGEVYKAQHKVNVESLKGHQIALANYQKQANLRRQQLEEEAKNNHTRSITGAVQTTDRYKEIEEELKYYEDAIKETEATIRDTTTSSIENIIALYEYNVSQMFKNLNTKNLGFGLSEAQTQWDLLNKEAEQYLDTMNTTFEMQKLESKFVEAINKTDNLKSQERIKTVMDEQLRILEEKDKVSQYDVDRANLIYDLTLKQIALEEAQQNKSKMRLRRDAQGNYSYQFSADADLIKQTQQELLDVQQQLYNLDKNEYKNQLDIMAGYYEEWQNKLQEVALIKDAEERERTAAMVNDYYTRLIENAANQSQVAEENLENLLNGPLADFKAGNEEIAEEIKTMYDSAFATMADNFAQEGGVADTIKQAWEEISDAAEDYLKQLKEISKVSKDSFANLEDPSKIVSGVEQITAATKDLNKAWNATLKSLKSLFTKIDNFLDSPEIKAAIKALTKSESKEKSEKKKAGDAAEKANKEAVAEPVKKEEPKKEPAKPAKPPKKEEPKKKEVKVGGQINAKGAYIYTYINKGRNTQLFASDPNYTVLKMQDGWVQVRHHKARPGVVDGWFKQSDVTALKSGGYTGNWNSEEGRLAFLHQKELVLNQRDTRNILDAVNIIRGLSGLLQNSMINRIEGLTQSLNNISIPTVQSNVETQPQSIEQTVHITAEFPGATEAIQIETALNSLVNRASQYANRKE